MAESRSRSAVRRLRSAATTARKRLKKTPRNMQAPPRNQQSMLQPDLRPPATMSADADGLLNIHWQAFPRQFLNNIGGQMSKENVNVVKSIYKAFGEGDIPAVFELFDP